MVRPGMAMHGFDVAVIGAGIIGASCAFRLSRAGLRVAVLEQHEAAAMGSTGSSAAGVRVQFGDATNVELSLASIREFRQFRSLYGRDSGYQPIGYLLLVPSSSWSSHLESVTVQRSLGAPVEILDLAAARTRFGDFSTTGLAGATYGPIDGVVDPHSVTYAYLDAARDCGAAVFFGSPVEAIERCAYRWELVSGEQRFGAEFILNAAGAWGGQVGQLAGRHVPVAPYRRSIYVTAPRQHRRQTPLTVDLATGMYFRSEGSRLLFGRSNAAQAPGFVTGVDWDWLEPTLEVATERFPWFLDEQLDHAASWYGYYEITPDHAPVLGSDIDEPAWLNACGFSGHGVQQAPAVGRALAEEIIDGRSHTINIDAFRGERFIKGVETAERNII